MQSARGDDCWTDENKLQRQYDYMEKHPECSLCAHNTGKAKMFHDWKKIHILTEEEVFLQWKVHTSSFFMRRNAVISVEKRFWFGDYMVLTQAFSEGQVAALPHVMSTYHCNNPNGVLRKINNLEMEEKIKKERASIEYLREFNIKTQFRYDEIIQARCKSIDYYCLQIECDYIILHSGSKSLSMAAAKKMAAHHYYAEYLGSKKGIGRWIRRYRYGGDLFYPLWKYIMRNSIANHV